MTVISCIVVIAVIGFIFSVKPKNLPAPEPVSPLAAVDERKAAIYENLRDLQFEYRVGKLSDEDYQSTKKDLQKELAAVLAEADRIKGLPAAAPAAPVSRTIPELVAAPAPQPADFVCVACGAKFEKELKFCGTCGEPMKAPTPPPTGLVCPACGAKFEKELKFCGECGKPMKAVSA